MLTDNQFVNKLLCKDRWFLAWKRFDGTAPSLDGTGGFQVLHPPPDRFYADPFVHRTGPTHWIVFEEFLYAKRKGILSAVEIGRDGRAGDVIPVLEESYHLSYPFLLEEAGELFMIPETSATGSIDLYRALKFPFTWRREQPLLNGINASDATIFRHEDLWWMFAAVGSTPASPAGSLHLFFSKRLQDGWQPHPANPLTSDPSCARPAGAVFRMGSRLIRPAQDCSARYGGALAFREIEVLNERQYRESLLCRSDGKLLAPGCSGTHTFNFHQGLEVRDGFVRRFDLYGKSVSAAARLRTMVSYR